LEKLIGSSYGVFVRKSDIFEVKKNIPIHCLSLDIKKHCYRTYIPRCHGTSFSCNKGSLGSKSISRWDYCRHLASLPFFKCFWLHF